MAGKSNDASTNFSLIVKRLVTNYMNTTPQSLKLIDSYMVFILLTGILQFVHVLLAGTFPYNAFLAGFASTVASFVFAGKCFILYGNVSVLNHGTSDRAWTRGGKIKLTC